MGRESMFACNSRRRIEYTKCLLFANVSRFQCSLASIFLGEAGFYFFFLKIPFAAYPNVTKSCHSRGIKQFNGQKLRDFHFLSVFGAHGNS